MSESNPGDFQPTNEAGRIESLDVLRGFALLGILLLNVIGFGLYSAAYSNAGFDLIGGSTADIVTWASVEILAEGAMRCLFSILFGAGVVLFTTSLGKSGWLHYKRTFWLLMFGLFDAYVLLWNGDILTTYAFCGALLYLCRNLSGKALLIMSLSLVLLIGAFYQTLGMQLKVFKSNAEAVATVVDSNELNPETLQGAKLWQEFAAPFEGSDAKVEKEFQQRRQSYLSAFSWNKKKVDEMLMVNIPLILFWDALAMMLLGMALFKFNVLQGGQPTSFYIKLMIAGFSVGICVNGYEVYRGLSTGFELTAIFAQMQPTYQFGRLGMAVGYLGLLIWLIRLKVWQRLFYRLAAVGRMALTNYLMHSLICAVIFTGLGFGLVGELSRTMLYPIVISIWLLQLFLSPLWLKHYRFGPVEWLWRGLTYGEWPAMKR